ncbi:MAG: hypothetical protein ACFFAS_01240 [Promethearchaeota archaeon]
MKGTENFYLINSNGKLIFSFENPTRRSEITRPEVLSDFLGLMEAIANRLGEQQINLIELGRSVIYSSLDKFTNILFIIKCDKKTKRKKMTDTMNRIRHEFIRIFEGNLNKSDDIKNNLMSEFINSMKKLFGENIKISYTIEELKFVL